LQEAAINSKNLSQAHVQAADILTELYSNLKEDQLLMVQMSSAVWRKVSICYANSLLSRCCWCRQVLPSNMFLDAFVSVTSAVNALAAHLVWQ